MVRPAKVWACGGRNGVQQVAIARTRLHWSFLFSPQSLIFHANQASEDKCQVGRDFKRYASGSLSIINHFAFVMAVMANKRMRSLRAPAIDWRCSERLIEAPPPPQQSHTNFDTQISLSLFQWPALISKRRTKLKALSSACRSVRSHRISDVARALSNVPRAKSSSSQIGCCVYLRRRR